MNNFRELTPEEPLRPLKENLSEDKYVAAVMDVFVNGRHQIEAELKRSKDNINVWPSAINTRVAVLEAAFSNLYKTGKINEENYRRINEKIQGFKEKIEDLFVEYFAKDNPPPENIKEDFLGQLEGLALDIREVIEGNIDQAAFEVSQN